MGYTCGVFGAERRPEEQHSSSSSWLVGEVALQARVSTSPRSSDVISTQLPKCFSERFPIALTNLTNLTNLAEQLTPAARRDDDNVPPPSFFNG